MDFHFKLQLILIHWLTLSLWLQQFGEGRKFYIMPEVSKMPCYSCVDHEQNLTLDMFANVSSQFLDQLEDIELVFLQGSYSFNSIIAIRNVSSFAMYSSTTSSVVNITCQGLRNETVGFHFLNISSVSMKDLKLIGCGHNKAEFVSHFMIENTIFIGQNGSGTALELVDTSTIIQYSQFNSNVVGTHHKSLQLLNYSNDSLSVAKNVYIGGALISNHSNVTVLHSSFFGNHAQNAGGAIYSTSGSNLTLVNSTFTENKVCVTHNLTCFGGALYFIGEDGYNQPDSQITIINSTFTGNEGFYGGVLSVLNSHVVVNLSTFHSNSATNDRWVSTGGVFDLHGKTYLTITANSSFYNNSCGMSGTVVSGTGYVLRCYNSSFINNTAYWFGGVITAISANLHLERCQFFNNDAYEGGVMFIKLCNVTISKCNFEGNKVYSKQHTDAGPIGGVLLVLNSCIGLSQSNFTGNTAFYGKGGALGMTRSVTLNISGCRFLDNQAVTGGGIYASHQSMVVSSGEVNIFAKNEGRNGAALALNADTVVSVYNVLIIKDNTANESGGGVFLYRSRLQCQDKCNITYEGNNASISGGGIFAINSIIEVLVNRSSYSPASMYITKNYAMFGGGIHLEQASQLQIIKSGGYFTHTIHSLFFTANKADFGGALYVADKTNFDTCSSQSVGSECFLQVLTTSTLLNNTFGTDSIEFVQNNASKLGSVLYGGLLDRCTLSPDAEVHLYRLPPMDSITFFYNVTIMTANFGTPVASDQIRTCLCSPNGHPDCSKRSSELIQVRKGENFSLSLVAVDQVNRVVPNAIIYTLLNNTESGLGVGQLVQVTQDNCTMFNFSIFSPYTSEELNLYAEGPCRSTNQSTLKVSVNFKECTCHVGFSPKLSEFNNCVCKCDPQLLPKFITSCDLQTHTLTRRGNSWISYLNITNDTKTYSYLTYLYCPLDYCLPPDTNVEINLNVQDGSDVQCQNNRSGLLCGICRPGLSVSLGTSSCISCDGRNDLWWLIPIFITAGVVLVTVLLILNMTVAVGTINGLIFYANIIGATSSMISSIKPVYVFLSWLNLDLGFDACFVDGLNTYTKTWIQMAFPTYIILLLIIMIVWSERSLKFSRLIGRRDPVASLATLIFLSYAKFLSIVITALVFITLDYPDGSYKVVWLPDASVNYFSAKHLVLVLVAIVILIVGGIYTILLLFWQWIRKWAEGKINHKVCQFFNIYQVPYNINHRYWPGLLLLARVILYLLFALNRSDDPRVNLIGVIIVMCALLLFKGVCGRVYQNWKIDVLELVSYVNIASFTAINLFTVQSNRNQSVAAYVSVFITASLLLMVISFHVYKEILSHNIIWKKLKMIPCFHSLTRMRMSTEIEHYPVLYNTLEARKDIHTYGTIGDTSHASLHSTSNLVLTSHDDGILVEESPRQD